MVEANLPIICAWSYVLIDDTLLEYFSTTYQQGYQLLLWIDVVSQTLCQSGYADECFAYNWESKNIYPLYFFVANLVLAQ